MTVVAEPTPWHDYDYAIVRVVPRVDRETFVNVGVVIHARRAGFLEARIDLPAELIARLAPWLDAPLLERFVHAYRRVVEGGPDAGALGLLPPSERFHWLTAPRSAVIQTSPVHPGRCVDLRVELDVLFERVCSAAPR